MRECVAAFVVNGDRVLLGRRCSTRSFYPSIWDVFGGHIEHNESQKDALQRELREELGITPAQSKFLLTVDEPNPAKNGVGQYHIYLVTDFYGEVQNLQPCEHAYIEWFPFEEALKLEFVDPLYLVILRQISVEMGKGNDRKTSHTEAIVGNHLDL